jgi:hypothetical protein
MEIKVITPKFTNNEELNDTVFEMMKVKRYCILDTLAGILNENRKTLQTFKWVSKYWNENKGTLAEKECMENTKQALRNDIEKLNIEILDKYGFIIVINDNLLMETAKDYMLNNSFLAYVIEKGIPEAHSSRIMSSRIERLNSLYYSPLLE